MTRLSLIIPALNEADCLPTLLAHLPPGLVDQLIVVDNGSTDGTAAAAQAGGAWVVSEPQRGYGYACAAGAAAAEGDRLAFMDGDGSFAPLELDRFMAAMDSHRAGLVLGSRLVNGILSVSMPAHQQLGNRLFVWLLRQRFGLQISDLGPFRLIRRDLLMTLDMQEHTFGWPLEMIIKVARRRQPIVEVPVSYRPRIGGQSKVGGTLRGSLLTAYRYFNVWLRYAV
jgi:glycosyltransferase involved in cell wall biosynthesis